MVELQIINKILEDKSVEILIRNKITINDFFKHRKEVSYILEHLDKYNVVPDKETFASKFNDFEFLIVQESEEYLIDTLKEEATFQRAVPIVEKASKIMESDSIQGIKFLMSNLEEIQLKPTSSIDLMKQATERYTNYLEKKADKVKMVTFSGFKELDKVIEGFSQEEELAVFFARLNNGKSWVVTKIAVEAWKQGRNVGFYSGEMSKNKVGFRVDSINKGFSNRALLKGYEVEGYKEYIEELKQTKNTFQIITPEDIDGYLTISKLENFIKEYKIDFMVIDQLSLMEDDKATNTTQERIKYSHITKGLKRISAKYHCPMILAVQANRMGVKANDEKGVPEMEHIAESDAVGQDATLAVSMRIKDNQLEMQIKKYRDGIVGSKFIYALDLDRGQFTYLPDDNSPINQQHIEEVKSKFNDGEDVF